MGCHCCLWRFLGLSRRVSIWQVCYSKMVFTISLLRDVGYETYKAHRQGPSPAETPHLSEPTRLGLAAVQRATFQSVASMSVYPSTRETLI